MTYYQLFGVIFLSSAIIAFISFTICGGLALTGNIDTEIFKSEPRQTDIERE